MEWFGEPWWSYICYDDAGRLRKGNRVPFPAGRPCLWCGEPFAEGDSGTRVPCVRADGGVTPEYAHKECQLRSVIGDVDHLEGRCSCHMSTGTGSSGLTKRQEAMAAWEWVIRHGKTATSASDR